TFWLGSLVARDAAMIHGLFKVLAALGAVLALHTIITAATGAIWFEATTATNHYGDPYFYPMGDSGLYRVTSFFIDPNWNGSFLALMLFIPLGLFAASRGLFEKTLFLAETALVSLALLLTFSVGACTSCAAGFPLFLVLVGRRRRLLMCLIGVAALTLLVTFP